MTSRSPAPIGLCGRGSWPVPERVAKRVGRADGWNDERDLSVGPHVVDDDLGVPGVAIPLERHREAVAVSRIELNEHRATPRRPNGKARALRERSGRASPD